MKILDKFSIYYLIIIFLLSLYVLGILTFGFEKVLWQGLPPALATTFTGFILDYLELKYWSKPLTPFITGLIIGLIAQFGAAPLTLVIIGILAMVIKFIVKWEGKHIFNPAGAGVVAGMLLFSSYPSWWVGAEFIWIYLIWIPIILYKMKRWAPMAGFLIPQILTSGLTFFSSASGLFFISVMLIEPKTSPSTVKLGLVYGLVVGIGFIALGRFSNFDPLTVSLLFGNLTQRVLGKYIN